MCYRMPAAPMTRLLPCLALLLVGCGSSGSSGAGEEGPLAPVAPPGSPIETTNRGWIGGACRAPADCPYAEGACLPAEQGFPNGLCSRPCDETCPDRDLPNDTPTFCVADRAARGTCVSRCDFAQLPGSGCRSGYGCTSVSRMGEPDKIVEVCMPLDSGGRARPLNDLQPMLERAAKASDMADARVVLMDVTKPGATVLSGLRLKDPVYPASVIKLLMMVEAEHQIEQGTLARTDRFSVTAEGDTCDSMPSGDTRPRLETGDVVNVDLLVDLMITRSDNTATNTLVDHVGRQKATAFMSQLGLHTLQIHRKVFGCEPFTDSGWDGVHINTMTAHDTGKLYELILDGGPGFVGPVGRERMKTVLADQRWRGGISATLPEDAVYLTKTGNTSVVTHDSGIILWNGRRYIVAAFLEMSHADGKPRFRSLGAEIGKIMAAR
jgi:beta-lactamase class A